MRGTMDDRNSFLASMLFSALLNVRRSERHMAQTRVPNKGSTGVALKCRHKGSTMPDL